MLKMLVVDDEPYTREYMKIHIPLLHNQWEVAFEASDGLEALDILVDHEVDLIITDIKMPEMDGLELSKAVSEKFPNQRIIILSGFDEFSLAKEAMHYGVGEYLLKPVVKKELQEAVQRVTAEIEEEKNSQLAYNTLKNFSDASRSHIVKNFLKAVVSNSHVKIKALYPLIHRFRINLIEKEGIIMILALDEDKILNRAIPVHDIPIFQFILNEISTEMMENKNEGWVFLDNEEQTIVFLAGDSEHALIEKCIDIHSQVSAVMQKNTGFTITAAVGNTENEVLPLYKSYENARRMLLKRLVSGGNTVYSLKEDGDHLAALNEFDQIISTIQSGLLNHNEMVYFEAVKQYVDKFGSYQSAELYRFGAYLIQCISKLNQQFRGELTETAVNLLKSLVIQHHEQASKDEVIHLLTTIIKIFTGEASSDSNTLNEHDAVLKAKEYIYIHYSEPLSLALIAEKIGFSTSYLSNIFHKNIGESYIKFLTRIRLEQAAKLLAVEHPMKIYEISEQVGYLSVKHFSHVFKQYFAVTPGEYQSQYNKIKL